MSEIYRGLSIVPVSKESIPDYITLFQETYPDFNPSIEYLDWLYFQNPNGDAIGFDAYDGKKLVAHYACIPINLNVFTQPALLALNTATHPNYQGRGLLKVLANSTYDRAGDAFSCVLGVANSKAINALTRHLNFVHIGNLDLRLGLLDTNLNGRRLFTKDEAIWRSNCPGRPLKVEIMSDNLVKFTKKIFRWVPISAYSPLAYGIESHPKWSKMSVSRLGLTLDWRKGKRPMVFLPSFLKPSPLSLVFRPLTETDYGKLETWAFQDFDAI